MEGTTFLVKASRRACVAAGVLLGLSALGGVAQAQMGMPRIEARPFVGAYIPTGDQRDLLKDAVLVGGQLTWHAMPALAVTGTFGWSPSTDRTTGDQPLDLYQYDIGAELRAASLWNNGVWRFTPFVGLGAGGRTYNYRDLDVDATTNFDGYGAFPLRSSTCSKLALPIC